MFNPESLTVEVPPTTTAARKAAKKVRAKAKRKARPVKKAAKRSGKRLTRTQKLKLKIAAFRDQLKAAKKANRSERKAAVNAVKVRLERRFERRLAAALRRYEKAGQRRFSQLAKKFSRALRVTAKLKQLEAETSKLS